MIKNLYFCISPKHRTMQYMLHLFISLLCLCIISCSNTPIELKTAEQLMETAPDSSLHILKKLQIKKIRGSYSKALYALLMSQALDKNDIKLETDSLISIATDYFDDSDPVHAGYAWFYMARVANNKGNAEKQADALLKAQGYAETTKNDKLRGLAYGDKGQMYKAQGQTDSAICYLKRSNQSLIKITDKRNYIINLLNLGTEYLKISRFDSVIVNYLLAAETAKNINDTLLISSIYRSLGSVYLKQKDYNQALYYYKKVPITSEEIYNSNKWFLQANVYVRTGETDSARYCLNKVKLLHEMAPDYYMLWQQVYEKEGDLNQSLIFSSKAINAVDSLYKTKLDVSFAGLEKKYRFQGLQIANQQLVIKNKQTSIVLLMALLVLTTLTVFLLFWRIRVKKQQLETQKQLVIQEHALVEKEKENTAKEKENSALLERQLKLQNILLSNIKVHQTNTVKRPTVWREGSKDTIEKQYEAFYNELKTYVDMEFNNFTIRLKEKHLVLTENDIFISCLLIAEFETGMMATIFNIQTDSMNKQRYRLRTKLKLSNSENLLDYLLHF